MLRVYSRLAVLRSMHPVIVAIGRRDADLARQLRRAASSVALNLCEGSGSEGGTRRQRHRDALGSAREVMGALDVAEAWGYVAPSPALRRELAECVAIMVSLAMVRRE